MNEQLIRNFAVKSKLAEVYDRYIDLSMREGYDDDDILEFEQVVGEFTQMIVGKCLEEIKDMLVDEDERLFAHAETTDCVNESLMYAHHNIALEFGFGKQFGVEE